MDLLKTTLRSGKRRPVIQLPTGAGKTICAAHIVHGALVKKNRVAFTVPSIGLIDQTFDRFVENGINRQDIGVQQGDHEWTNPNAPVQICSVQTLAKRSFPDSTFVVIDEAHLQFEIIQKWMALDAKRIFVGLSATPWAKSMGNHYDDLIIPTTIEELTTKGLLCGIRAFAPSTPDLTDVKIVDGDYHNGQLSEKMSGVSIVGDMVQTWCDRARGLQTLVFAVDRGHGAALHKGFERTGSIAAYIDGLTPRGERIEITKKFQNRDIDVIVSISTMTTGTDLDVECISYGRPTKSEILWVQTIGRGLRPMEGKLLLLDHSGTALRLGLPADIKHSRLRVTGQDGKEVEQPEAVKMQPKPRECFKCKGVIPATFRACPECGWVYVPPDNVMVEEGDLYEIGSAAFLKAKKDKRKENREATKADKARFYGELRGYALEKGWKDGWAANKYREKFDVWPNDPEIRNTPALQCGMVVRAWLRAQWIKQVKSKEHQSKKAMRAEADRAVEAFNGARA